MRVLSGTQPTQEHLHIGNYFGALRQQVELQQKYETLIFIADLHSMNSVRDAEQRRCYSNAVALDFLSCGLDPAQAILFRQSDVPEVCELAWYLSTVTPMGLLERGHAYKDKVAQGQSANHGLFAYPVLMAADILLYRADLVPVGRDQKQHIEMARDMAEAFNRTYDREVLTLPKPQILDDVAVVPGTDGRKMSKSYDNGIPMFATEKQIKKAVMGIVTDSGRCGRARLRRRQERPAPPTARLFRPDARTPRRTRKTPRRSRECAARRRQSRARDRRPHPRRSPTRGRLSRPQLAADPSSTAELVARER